MSLLQEYIKELLVEKQRRGEKDKRTLYHINMRPARPQPKVKMMQAWDSQARDRFGEKGDFVLMVIVCFVGDSFSMYMVSIVLIYKVSNVSHGLINTFIS